MVISQDWINKELKAKKCVGFSPTSAVLVKANCMVGMEKSKNIILLNVLDASFSQILTEKI